MCNAFMLSQRERDVSVWTFAGIMVSYDFHADTAAISPAH